MIRPRSSSLFLYWFRALVSLALASYLITTLMPVRAAAEEPDPGYLDEFSTDLDLAMRTGEFVGLAVAVVDHGRITFLKSYGETAIGSGDPVTDSTAFRFASVSKGFSAALVGQLAEEGRLSWSDPVTQYDPEFRLNTTSATNAVTVEDLASHRTGLPAHAYDNIIEAGRSFETAVANLPRADLVCQPGQCYQYQNVAFSLLGGVVESADGRPFDEAMNARLFQRLGMENASVGINGLETSASWAHGHARRRASSPWIAFSPNDNYYRVAPAGGLNGSISDLALWARAQMGYNPDVLDEEVRAELQTGRVDTPQERRKMRWMRSRLRDADYALGWRVYDYAGERMIMHSGGVSGYRALVAFMPEHDIAVVGLWNTSNTLGWRILPTFFDAYLGLDRRDWLGVSRLRAQLEAEEQAQATANGSP